MTARTAGPTLRRDGAVDAHVRVAAPQVSCTISRGAIQQRVSPPRPGYKADATMPQHRFDPL